MAEQAEKRERWHIDRGISLTLIFAVGVQLVGFSWYASALNEKVEQNTRDIIRLEAQRDLQSTQAGQLNDRVIRIEERLGSFGDVLDRIDKTLTDYIKVQEERAR